MNANDPINHVRTIADLFALETVHLAIAKAVSKSIVNLRHNHDLARKEATSEICTQLIASLGKYKRPPAVPKIRNEKFLRSPNRLGWISLFAQNVTKGWISDRANEAAGDDRIEVALREHHLPAETFESEQARARQQAEVAALDPYQFAGKKCRPRIEQDPHSFGEREPVEPQSLDTQDAERLARIRGEIERLGPDDRDFFEGYVTTWHERGIRHTPAERKRFERLSTESRYAPHQPSQLSVPRIFQDAGPVLSRGQRRGRRTTAE